MQIGAALTRAGQRLPAVSSTPALDAQVLLAHVLARPRAWILAHPEVPLNSSQFQAFEAGLTRLLQGDPLPYVLGHWEFFGLDFLITPDVLIPRPESELLVETALGWLRRHPERRLAADVGTGSGCIAVTLAAHLPDLRVFATDLSLPALQVARRNAIRHNVSAKILFLQANLLDPLPLLPSDVHFPRAPAPSLPRSSSPLPLFDLIAANLPYIPTETLISLEVARREPWLALHGGAEGLDLIRSLLRDAPGRLAPGGLLLLEIEAGQGQAAGDLARKSFPQAEMRVLQDLAGKDRLVKVELPVEP